ncbi:flippase-like domain-containing protein [Natronospirillum operosum]|uniref:Flippase-like domain-containing protein n=1 Tax=Natronospirillum operosum TaxID=2759953 RepID=A0A4Z0W5G2_9GAMM|nr:lysylphosphatidylglycerol synthase transmembrane domain-containing protein [Natronospirillum operosum]TGG92107.1 flippase-like domain-containing protein [Natronospirillum operosum]
MMTVAVRWQPLLKWLVAIGLLVLVLLWIDPEALLAQFATLHPGWLGLALLVGALQIVLSAGRWWYTARQLGLRLSFRRAVADYFLSTLVNQVVPGGVMGDVARGLRHGVRLSTSGRQYGAAIRAVMLERLSGQLVLLPLLAVLLLATVSGRQVADTLLQMAGEQLPILGALLILVLAMAAALKRLRLPALKRLGTVLREDAGRALLRWPVVVWQGLSSLAVVGSYLLLFLLCARALGVSTPALTLLPLIPLVLLGMLVPFTVSGWGVREGVAALLWPLAGLPAAEGVALSMLYGVLILLSSLPGLLTVLGETLAQSKERSNSVSGPSSKRRKSGRSASSS